MGKRFAFAFLLTLLYMGLLCIPVYALTFLDGDVLPWGIGAALLIICGTFPLVVDRIVKLSFHFRGEGARVSEKVLRELIAQINFHDLPIEVGEKKRALVVTWKYKDARWWELMSKLGVTESFKVIVKLDNQRKRATMIDVFGRVKWGKGPDTVRYSWSWFRGVYLGYGLGKAWGIRENFTLGKLYDFTFDSREIHNTVMNTILRSGWDVRFGLW